MADMTQAELAALYPDGRHLYYEGDDLEAFKAAMHAVGIEVHVNVTVDVPPEKLKYVMSRFPMGS
jgi:hypothetical protein